MGFNVFLLSTEYVFGFPVKDKLTSSLRLCSWSCNPSVTASGGVRVWVHQDSIITVGMFLGSSLATIFLVIIHIYVSIPRTGLLYSLL